MNIWSWIKSVFSAGAEPGDPANEQQERVKAPSGTAPRDRVAEESPARREEPARDVIPSGAVASRPGEHSEGDPRGEGTHSASVAAPAPKLRTRQPSKPTEPVASPAHQGPIFEETVAEGGIAIRDLANQELLDLIPYEPGKPVEDVARELGLKPSEIIKLASNENPLGPSPKAVAAMREAVANVHFYPDGGGFHLRNAIAERVGLERSNVVLGNGSNEIIELLFHSFTRPGVHEVVTGRNSFAVYELMAQLFGVRCVKVADIDFEADLDATLAAIKSQTRLVFIASPNNPTGTRVPNDRLEAFLDEVPPHVVVVLDEAYYEFLEDAPDTVQRVRDGQKVVLMRTFSKIQGLAGLRIGYGLASAPIADVLQRARQPFNANAIAQAAALAAINDDEHQQKTRDITIEGRALLESSFAEMGLPYVPSQANFVLVKVGDADAVFQALLRKGIIVRSMKSYRLPEYIRVSVGTPEQNKRFLAELPGVLE